MESYYRYSDFKYMMEEFMYGILYEIYSASKNKKVKKEYKYIIVNKFKEDGWNRFDTSPIEYNTKKEAMKIVKKHSNKKEKDEFGKTHYYREYTCYTNGIETKERYEIYVERITKGYFPEYSKTTLKTLKKSIKSLKESMVFAQNISKFTEGDIDQEEMNKNIKEKLELLKKEPLFSESLIEEFNEMDKNKL